MLPKNILLYQPDLWGEKSYSGNGNFQKLPLKNSHSLPVWWEIMRCAASSWRPVQHVQRLITKLNKLRRLAWIRQNVFGLWSLLFAIILQTGSQIQYLKVNGSAPHTQKDVFEIFQHIKAPVWLLSLDALWKKYNTKYKKIGHFFRRCNPSNWTSLRHIMTNFQKHIQGL